MAQERENPFTPGWGFTPPHRAGHADAVRQLEAKLDRIGKGRPAGGVILYGPRGTGKTVLLNELCRRAKKRKMCVSELNTGDMTGRPEKLGRMLTPWRWFHRLAIRRLTAMFPWGGGAGVEFGDSATNSAGRALRLLLKDPVLLIVDEAHEMPPSFAMVLLQVAQRCIRDDLPLLVVLAGTPAIEANLSQAHASFWERSRQLRIGRLESEDDIRAALSLPAEREGMPFSPDALALLMKESQGYPFFIQLLGEQSWDAAIARDPGAEHITLEDAQLGVSMARRERDALYGRRLQEIMDRDLESEALAVSKAFVAPDAGDALSRATLGAVLKPALTGDRTIKAAINELFAVGLIWQTDNPSLWEPGIPSLCAHITEHVVID